MSQAARLNPAFLDLTTREGVVVARYQNHWPNQSVTFETFAWAWLDFDWDALSGAPQGMAEVNLTLPGLPSYRDALEEFSDRLLAARLRVFYYLDSQADSSGPPAAMTLIAAAMGMFSLRELTLTSLSASIGPTLGGAGQQTGDLLATPALIGTGVDLGEA